MREFLVDLQRGVLQELGREQGRVSDRHDLVVIAVHDEGRHGDDLQVFGEVGFGEGLDAVVMRLGAPIMP